VRTLRLALLLFVCAGASPAPAGGVERAPPPPSEAPAPIRLAGLADSLPRLFVDVINNLIRGEIRPARITYKAPATLLLENTQLVGADGVEVARVARASVDVAVTPLFSGDVVITRLDLEGPSLTLLMRDGKLNIIEALRAKKSGQPGKPPPNVEVKISNISIARGRFSFANGDVKVRTEGIAGTARVNVDVRKSHVTVVAQGLSAKSGRLDLEELGVPFSAVRVDRLRMVGSRMQITGGRGRVLEGDARLAGTLNFKEGGRYTLDGHLKAPRGTWPEKLKPLEFTPPSVDVDVSIRGPVKEPYVSVSGGFGAVADLYGYSVDGGSVAVDVDKKKVKIRSATLRLGEGRVRADGSFVIKNKLLDLNVRAESLSVARALQPAKPKERPRGLVGGTARIVGVADGEAPLQVTADLIARNARLYGVRPPSPLQVGARLTVTGGRVDLERVKATGRGLDARVDGRVRTKAKELDLALTVDAGRPLALVDDMPEELRIPGAKFSGRVRGPFDEVRVTGDVRAPEANAWGVPLAQLSARLEATAKRVAVSRLRGEAAGGALEGDVVVGLPARGPATLAGEVKVEGADLAALRTPDGEEIPLKGHLTLGATLGGDTKKPAIELRAEGHDVEISGESFGEVLASGQVSRERLTLWRLWADGPLATLRSRGPVWLGFENLDFGGELGVRIKDLAQVKAAESAKLKGAARGRLLLGGKLAAPDVKGWLDVDELSVREMPFGGGPLYLHFVGEKGSTDDEPRRAIQASARLQGPRGLMEVRAAWALERERLHAAARLVEVDLAPWLEGLVESVPRAAGLVSGHVSVWGPVDALEGSARLHMPEVVFKETDTDAGQGLGATAAGMTRLRAEGPLWLDARLDDGELYAQVCAFPRPDLFTASPCGAGERVWITASGPVDLEAERYDLAVRAYADESFLERYVPALREQGVRLGAVASADLRVKQESAEADLDVGGVLDVLAAHVEIEGAPPGDLVEPVRLLLDGQQVSLAAPLRVAVGDSELRVQGRAGPDDTELQVDGTVALALAKLYLDELSRAEGTVEAHLRLVRTPEVFSLEGGVKPQPGAAFRSRSLRERVELLGGEVRFEPAARRGAGDDSGEGAEAASDDEGIAVRIIADDLEVRAGDGRGVFAGEVALARGSGESGVTVTAWDLRARGAGLRVRGEQLWVESAFDLHLVGEQDAPRLTGRLEVTDGLLRERFEMRNFVLTSGPSRPSEPLYRSLEPVGLADLALDVDVDVRDFRVRADLISFPLDANVTGTVHLENTVRVPALAGALEISEGSVLFPHSRFEFVESNVEFPRERKGLEPKVALFARGELQPRTTGCETELPVQLSLEGDDLDRIAIDLQAEESRLSHDKSDLLASVLLGLPLTACRAEAGAVDPDAMVRAFSSEFTAGLTAQLEETIQEQFGGELQVNVFLQGGRLATDVRWEIGRRLVVEGESPIVALAATDSADDSARNLRLRLLFLDHVPPLSSDLFLEGGFEQRDGVSQEDESTVETRLKLRFFEY
jgi:hypothetical protein